MKKLVIVALSVLFFGCSASTNAQDSPQDQKKDSKVKETAKDVKEGVKEGAQDVKEAGKEVGNKTAEVAVKGASEIKDKKLKDKVGPDGQTIYIDKYSNYYWVNDKGRKIYVSKSGLKSK